MGQDKAFLRLGEAALLDVACKLAESVTQHVHVVGDVRKFAMYKRVVEDIYPDRGPLGGIHAALAQTRTDLNLVIAVDVPFIGEKFLDFLVSEARICNAAVVVVPRIGGFMHPLCAVYRREFATVCEKALIRGENKIDILFANVQTRVIEEKELISAGFLPEMFRNINTVEDWRQAQASQKNE